MVNQTLIDDQLAKMVKWVTFVLSSYVLEGGLGTSRRTAGNVLVDQQNDL
jgi:hypothetical protein